MLKPNGTAAGVGSSPFGKVVSEAPQLTIGLVTGVVVEVPVAVAGVPVAVPVAVAGVPVAVLVPGTAVDVPVAVAGVPVDVLVAVAGVPVAVLVAVPDTAGVPKDMAKMWSAEVVDAPPIAALDIGIVMLVAVLPEARATEVKKTSAGVPVSGAPVGPSR
jgi:antitoxin (DNA-binding transcriptional repressor) of toxin-antitoxin stability system